ncbi:flippase-like domain-containing protein [bacterium]|nr:flippase-like domain-containing protein [bacterium]
MKKRFIISILASVLILYLIIWIPRPADWFRGELTFCQALVGETRINFGELWRILLQIRFIPLMICFLITPLHVLIRSHRWIQLVKPVGNLKLLDSFSLQMVGYMANSVLPFRIGELARGVLLGRRIGISKSSALGTVVLERTLDMLSLLALIAVTAILYEFPSHLEHSSAILKEGAKLTGIIAGAIVLVLIYLTFIEDPFIGFTGRMMRLLPGEVGVKISGIVRQFSQGFAVLKSPRSYLLIIFETALLWFLYGLQVLVAMIAFGFTGEYPQVAAAPLLTSFVVLTISAVALSVPSAPGGVGTFHGAVILALALYGIGANEAAGFALVLHLVSMVYYIFGGIPFMGREGLKLGQLQQLNSNMKL